MAIISFFILLDFLDFSLPVGQGDNDFSVFYDVHLNMASKVGNIGAGPFLLGLLLEYSNPLAFASSSIFGSRACALPPPPHPPPLPQQDAFAVETASSFSWVSIFDFVFTCVSH